MIILVNSRHNLNRSSARKVIQINGFVHIFSNFSALTTGLALAMASFPMALKSKVHPCCSGYRWLPQKVVPHLHRKPINPTFFLHVKHLLGWCSTTGCAATGELSGKDTVGHVSTMDDDGATKGGDVNKGQSLDLEFFCVSFRQRSP